MKAPRKPEADPKQDAESATGVPERPDARANSLDELFGHDGALAGRTDADVAASRAQLAELFGQPPQVEAEPTQATDDMAADLDAFFGPHESTPKPLDDGFAWEPAAPEPRPPSLDAPSDLRDAPAPVDVVAAPAPAPVEETPAPAEWSGAARGGGRSDLTDVPAPVDEVAAPAPAPLEETPGPAEWRGAAVAPAAEPDPGGSDEPLNTAELLAILGLGDASDDEDDEDDEPESEDRSEVPAAIAATAVVVTDDRTEIFAPVAATDLLAPDDQTQLPAPGAATEVLTPDGRPEALAPVAATQALPATGTEAIEPVPARTDHDDRTRVLVPAAAVAASGDTSVAPPGSFMPARRRGIFAWSTRVRWSVAASVVLLAAVVAGAVIFAQNLAANNQAAQALAAAVAELEGAESNATEPYGVMESAFADYDAAALAARAAADSAGPALASVAGMTDEAPLAAANAALAALVAQLDDTTLAEPPERYERGDVDLTDPDQIAAAAQTASNRAEVIATATREARAAQAALVEKVAALTAAQVALGSSLPAKAVIIVGENPQAEQSFRDAVVATSVAVPAAQAAGGSGDAELLAYAAAVTALRADEVRAQDERSTTPVTPPRTDPDPVPVPEPVPEPPAPEPAPPPAPVPTETLTPEAPPAP